MQFKDRSIRLLPCPTPLALVLLWLSASVFAQSPKLAQEENFTPGTDVSLGLMGQMTYARTPIISTVSGGETLYSQVIQSESPSAGALVTLHKTFRPYLGYNLNFSYTQFTQTNSLGRGFTPTPGAPTGSPGTFAGSYLDRRMYEMTAAYAVDGPRSKRIRSFAQLGAGALVFDPTSSPLAHELKSCATIVFGAGGEYDVSRHFSIRAEYRGLLYRMPNTGFAYYFPSTGLYTVTNLPAISLVYHFRSSSNPKHLANGQWGPY